MEFDLNFLLGIILFVVASVCWLIWAFSFTLWDHDKMENLIVKYHPRKKEVDGYHLQEKLISQTVVMCGIITIPLMIAQAITITVVILLMNIPESLLLWQSRLFVISNLLMFAITCAGASCRVSIIKERCRCLREQIARDIEYLEAIEKEKSFVK